MVKKSHSVGTVQNSNWENSRKRQNEYSSHSSTCPFIILALVQALQ